MSEAIERVFGAGGLLAKGKPDYKPRPTQIQYAAAVERAIADRKHLLIEGPVGLGKSFAYLAPAILSGKRVMVVTHNIALQEQLVKKDLPALQAMFAADGVDFTFALIKGFSNYLCKKSLDENEGEIDDEALLDWAHTTETGDKSELRVEPSGKNWSKLSVSSEDCTQKSCKHCDSCFVMAPRRKAKEARIVVANYHFFYLDLKYNILPPAEVVILDEVHTAADIGRQVIGDEVSRSTLKKLVKEANMASAKLSDALDEAGKSFFTKLLRFAKSRDYHIRLHKPIDDWSESQALLSALRETTHRLGEKLMEVARGVDDIGNPLGTDPNEAWKAKERFPDLANAVARAGRLTQRFASLIAHSDENSIDFIEIDEHYGNAFAKLVRRAKRVGPFLADTLYGSATVIATSATLTTGNVFNYIRDELGLESATPETNASELRVKSPFDYASQALFIVPDRPGVPSPKAADGGDHPGWAPWVEQTMVDIVKMARGRTLLLFTTRKMMDRVYAALLNERLPYTILKQDLKPRTRLIEEFKSDVSSVLLGVESFWAGVDVPGEACSCVVMDKINFPVPVDPIIDALCEGNTNAFGNVSVPRAIVDFRQGFGRCIRTVTDRGVIVCLDARLMRKGYGKRFLADVRDVPLSNDIEDAGRFLA